MNFSVRHLLGEMVRVGYINDVQFVMEEEEEQEEHIVVYYIGYLTHIFSCVQWHSVSLSLGHSLSLVRMPGLNMQLTTMM